MKVKQLIERLQKFDPNAEIKIDKFPKQADIIEIYATDDIREAIAAGEIESGDECEFGDCENCEFAGCSKHPQCEYKTGAVYLYTLTSGQLPESARHISNLIEAKLH